MYLCPINLKQTAMKLENVLLTLFFIAMIFVFLGLIFANVDVFMWSAAIGDIIGLSFFIMHIWFDELLKIKVW